MTVLRCMMLIAPLNEANESVYLKSSGGNRQRALFCLMAFKKCRLLKGKRNFFFAKRTQALIKSEISITLPFSLLKIEF